MDLNTDYTLLSKQLKSLIEGERNAVAGMANASALINGAVSELNWVGFYLTQSDGSLLLGPFQGKPACIRLAAGAGVCGAAAHMGHSVLVADVSKFPGHIACDAASASELVVPISAKGRVVAVLDMDSPWKSRFSTADQAGIEALVRLLEADLDWPTP